MLTAMLSDRRLSLNHQTMEDLLVIKANHNAWTTKEMEDIMEESTDHFMSSKRRKLRMETGSNQRDTPEPPMRFRQDITDSEDDSNSDSGGSERTC